MGAVRVQEAGLGAGSKALEGELGARGPYGSTSENLARQLDARSQLQPVFAQLGHLACIDGGEVFARRNLFHLFHSRIFLCGFVRS